MSATTSGSWVRVYHVQFMSIEVSPSCVSKRKLAKGQRDDILRQLCLKGVKLRQLSRITGISYGTINRAKSGPREPSP